MLNKQTKRQKSHRKIRMKISGTKEKPRLSVFRSAKYIYAQIINDENGKVLVSASDFKLKSKKGKKIDHALEIGKLIAKEALAKKIEKVVFDRGGLFFHCKIKADENGAREGGLKF